MPLHGQRSTFIDLLIASNPLKCSNWRNICNLTSEHEGVICDYNFKDAMIKEQFRVIRDNRQLNYVNISKKLEEVGYFNDEIKLEDVDALTMAVKEKLNKVLQSLAPMKRIQLKRETEFKRDEETTKIFKEAKEAKYVAIKNKDGEMFRKARNLTAIANRMSYRKQAEKYKYQMKHQKLKWKKLKS